MKKVVIVSAQRTPVGKFRGKLSRYSAVELGTFALKSAIDKIQIDPAQIQNIILKFYVWIVIFLFELLLHLNI